MRTTSTDSMTETPLIVLAATPVIGLLCALTATAILVGDREFLKDVKRIWDERGSW